MRARYYESTSGRFVSEDPALNGHHWFTYAGNDPINHADSSGQWEEDIYNLLMKAWDIVKNNKGWGYGTVENRVKLQKIVEALKMIAKINKQEVIYDLTEDMIEADRTALMNDPSMMQARIDDIKTSIHAANGVWGAVAKVAVGLVRIMMEMLKSGPYDFD